MLRPPTSALLMLAFAAEQGVSAHQTLKACGISGADLRAAGAKVDHLVEQQMLVNMLEALGYPPGLGLQLGQRYSLASYGIWGFALMSAPTMAAAFFLGQRYVALTYSDLAVSVQQDGEWLDVSLDASALPRGLGRFLVEREAAAILAMQRELYVQAVPPAAIALAHPDAGSAVQWQSLFGVWPRFEAEQSSLRFSAKALSRPLPQANPIAAQIAEAQCRQLLQERSAHEGSAGQVRSVLLRASGGRLPSLEEIAQQLHCTSRTLRRRLDVEATSYRRLIDEVRQLMAEELALTPGMKVEELARHLGFSEAASYLHARKRWRSG